MIRGVYWREAAGPSFDGKLIDTPWEGIEVDPQMWRIVQDMDHFFYSRFYKMIGMGRNGKKL